LARPDPLREHDDASLVRLAAVGDRDALDVLLTRHIDRVHAICRHIVGSREGALDATQAALIDIAGATARLDGSDAFETSLLRAATNAAIEQLRRRDPAPPAAPEPSDDRTEADRALEAMPVERRVAVVLRDLCGLDDDRIAAVLEVPATTVRSGVTEADEVRALVREPVPPLDDLTRRRLVRTAVRAGPREITSPSRRRVKVLAIAAAVLLAVISVGAVLAVAQHSDDGSSGDRGDSRAAVLRGDVGDLGDVTSPAALRSLLDRRARHRGGPDAGSSSATTAPGVKDCIDELAGQQPATFTGTATYRGRPAAVVGVAHGGRTIVFVVARASCTDVLASISR
jgi:RNA polymerase sigma-70 factor (ECF subfamily)